MRVQHIIIQVLFIALLFHSCSTPEKEPKTENRKTTSQTLFKLLSPNETGIDFMNHVKETEENNYFNNQYIYNGGGVAVGDLNNDGFDDIYFTGNQTDDKLYLNKGNLKFEEITTSAGIKTGDDSWSSGVSFVDLNSDGWLDIYVCKAGINQSEENKKNQLYINKKDGTFYLDEISQLADPALTTQASFFDMDMDGDLDVYLINYPENFDDSQVAGEAKEVPLIDSDHLYRNDGQGNFTDITKTSGITNYAFGLGIITADFNNDLFPDIYVANDFIENDFLYINNKNGTFSERIKYSTGHNSQSSMGIDRADIDNDGFEDFFVAEMLPSDYKRSKVNMASMNIESFWYSISQGNHYQYMHNVLQVNNQNGYFSDVSQMAGVEKTDWSWSPVLEDFDNDGLIDLFVSNGILKDMFNKDAKSRRKSLEKKGENLSLNQLYEMIPSTKLSNYIYQNQGDFKFKNQSQNWGITERTFSNGATTADLDNDGDLDLIINNLEDPAYIYENRASENGNNHLTIELEWPNRNSKGVNAKIELFKNGKIFSREILPTAGYQSGRSPKAHFGLGEITSIDSARVFWNFKAVQSFNVEALNTTQKVTFNPSRVHQPTPPKKYFKSVNPSDFGITFEHQENQFNDFEKEILLPHRQSTVGPALTVGDINGDGLDDLVLGGASGQKSRVCLQKSNGKFQELDLGRSEYETMDAAIFDLNGDQFREIYLVNGGNETNSSGRKDMLYANNSGTGGGFTEYPRARPSIGGVSGSCIVAEDFNADGQIDLFIGGRAKPNAYPLADSSYMCISSENKKFKQVNNWLPKMPEAGFITCAVSTDFNQDGKPDLVLAGEWTPVMFFENTGSSFKDVTSEKGAPEDIGWWYSLKAADMDGDGIEEIIAGNMGENHKFRPSHENPFVIYYDDYDQNGQGDIVLANTSESGECQPVRGKQCMSEQMPFISKEKVKNYNEFANANLSELVGKDIEQSKVKLQATMFSSSLFRMNSSGKFFRESLPAEAQKSAINAIEVIDINLDGELDLILTGNMYDTEVETTRADASTGCVLLSGKTAVRNSGLFVPGNAKKSSLINIQGETYLLVAINNGKCQMFKVLI